MSEEGAAFALWGDEAEAVEDELDIQEDLRRSMKAWAKEYSDRRSGMAATWTPEELMNHDRRGYSMSQELQAVLSIAAAVADVRPAVEVRLARQS